MLLRFFYFSVLFFGLHGSSFCQSEYFSYEIANMKNKTNSDDYPKPSINDTALFALLKQHAVYPEFAKKNLLSHKTDLIIQIDSLGKIAKKSVKDLSSNDFTKIPLFDTNALNLIDIISDKWMPGAKPSNAYILPISYDVIKNVKSDKVYFMVSIFNYPMMFFVDSSDTYPAFFHDTVSYSVFPRRYELPLHQKFLNRMLFGGCRHKVEIDAEGKIQHIEVVKGSNESLSAYSLKEIEKLPGVWVPARIRGVAVTSSIDFDLMYDSEEYNQNGSFKFLEKSAPATYRYAFEYFKEKNFIKSLEYFERCRSYYFDSINLLNNIVVLNLILKKYDNICYDLYEIKKIGMYEPYPFGISEDSIDAILNNKCK
jgi:hypothetical protein